MARTFKSWNRRSTREANDRISQAYLTARLVRVAAKSFPRLKKLLLRDPNRKPQSWQDMKQIAMQLTLAHGGEVKGTS